jgi:small GTP-binding protein
METIVEEDEKDVKMYERESIQSKQNIKKDNNDNDNDDIKRKISVGSSHSNNSFRSQESNRFTKLNDTVLNAVETFQVEEQKDLIENMNIEDNIYGQNSKEENNINEINNDEGNEIKITQTLKDKLEEYKIIILGDFGVGKSSLIFRFLNNRFKKETDDSPKAENNRKIIQIDSNIRIIVNIWDTSDQEKGGKLQKIYYKDIYGALLVFDLTNKDSFDSLRKWLNELKDNSPEDIVYCFAGNKSDLKEERAIEYETIKDFVNENLYYEVSSKTGNNVSLAFEQLAYNIVMKQAEEEGNPDKVIRGIEGRQTQDLRMSTVKPKKKCC